MKFLRVAKSVPEAQSLTHILGQPQATRNYPVGVMGLKGSLALFSDVFCPSQIIIGEFIWHLCRGCLNNSVR